MRVAGVGSRSLRVDNLGEYLPAETVEIVSGGAKGIDACARAYALGHGVRLVEFLPDYGRYGRAAPLRRNLEIIGYSDLVLVFWDGRSRGARHVIAHCKRLGVPARVFLRERPL